MCGYLPLSPRITLEWCWPLLGLLWMDSYQVGEVEWSFLQENRGWGAGHMVLAKNALVCLQDRTCSHLGGTSASEANWMGQSIGEHRGCTEC